MPVGWWVYRGLTQQPSVSKGKPMTTLKNRPNTAILVGGGQNGTVKGAPARDGTVANVPRLVATAGGEGVG